jgi:GT2 family glycosyltransferase
MDNPKVAVVILNYNSLKFLKSFLASVCATDYDNFEVVVADNASSDNSPEWVETNYPAVRVIRLKENYGFTGGYNRALTQVDAKYYVLLNSDVEVPVSWLKPMVSMAEGKAQIAAIQPTLIWHSHRDTYEYAGAAGGFIDKYGYPFCRGRLFENLEKNTGQYSNPIPVFWASGAAMFIRKSCWDEVNGLDEDFFAHMEEIDICWRLQNRGYTVMSCPESVVYHVGGGTLSKENPQKTYYNFRNGLILLLKNLPSSKLIPVLFTRILLDKIAAYRWLFSGKSGDFKAVARAHFSFFIFFRKWLKKRDKSDKSAYFGTAVYRKSIVGQTFLGGKKYFSELGPFFSVKAEK